MGQGMHLGTPLALPLSTRMPVLCGHQADGIGLAKIVHLVFSIK